MFQFSTAQRKKAKLKIGIAGPAGSGKTFSSILLAKGLAKGDLSKVAFIDTENRSGDLFSDLGPYQIGTLAAPFTPERYIEAIESAEKQGFEVIIIDSMTHEWDGKGGILEMHDQMGGNSFTTWARITPRHNAFIQKILQSPCHIICTLRAKQDYVLVDKNGKQVPEKIGLKAITREGVEYEFTLAFDLNMQHIASASKDRTRIFTVPDFISEETGKKLLSWANEGITTMPTPATPKITEEDVLKTFVQPPDFETPSTPENFVGWNQPPGPAQESSEKLPWETQTTAETVPTDHLPPSQIEPCPKCGLDLIFIKGGADYEGYYRCENKCTREYKGRNYMVKIPLSKVDKHLRNLV